MSFYFGHHCFWVRIGHRGRGLNLLGPDTPALFSERYGYRKPLVRLLGWRLFALEPMRL